MTNKFSEWIGRSIHECAPDHSTHLAEVGRLRRIAAVIDEAITALEAGRHALADWMEIADEADKRETDEVTINQMATALLKLRSVE